MNIAIESNDTEVTVRIPKALLGKAADYMVDRILRLLAEKDPVDDDFPDAEEEAAADPEEEAATEQPEAVPPAKKEHGSRNSHLFADYIVDSIGNDPKPSSQRTAVRAEMEERNRVYDREGYSGLLLMKCEHCGDVNGFFTKASLKKYHCHKCDGRQDIRGLIPAHLHCSGCGAKHTYLTNMDADEFDIACHHCGTKLHLKKNLRGDTYVTDFSGGGYRRETYCR